MRIRSLTPVLLVALLVVLAGCGGSAGPSPSNQSNQSNQSSQSPPYQAPLNGSEIDAAHRGALEQAGNYTYHVSVNSSVSSSAGSGSIKGDVDARIDTQSGAQLVDVSSPKGNVTVFQFGNGTAYTRLHAGTVTRYVRGDGMHYNTSSFASVGVKNLTSKVNFSYAGASTLEGDTVYQYVAHENQTLSGYGAANASTSGNVTSTVRLFVRGDGLVKRYEVHVRTDSGSADFVAQYTKVGSTRVAPPAWIRDAKNATSS